MRFVAPTALILFNEGVGGGFFYVPLSMVPLLDLGICEKEKWVSSSSSKG